jgi:hypothetical protein
VSLIADSVSPRFPVGATKFSWTSYNDKETLFTIPETRVGPTSKMNRVQLKGARTTAETYDNGLEIPLSYYDVNGQSGPDARRTATEALASWIGLRREYDVASKVFNAATYAAANKTQLSTADQFQTTATSHPLKTIGNALRKMLVRGNVAVFGDCAWFFLRQHPDIVKAVHGNAGDSGMVTRQQVADLLEVQEVLVGTAWLNTAKPGETVTMTRVWGPHVALLYRDQQAARIGGITFAATAQYGTKVAGSYQDPEIGLRGGEVMKAGESICDLVVAADCGYFIEDAAVEPA